MDTHVDLAVIGTGSAAGTVAHRCRQAGWSVTVIDSRPYGGTCQLRGCDPKRVLVGGAELADRNRRMLGQGATGGARLDWPALLRFKRTFTDPAPAANEADFARAGIGMLHGRARFLDPTTLQVGQAALAAGHIVIAGGARHAPLGIVGEDLLATSSQFLELAQLPPRIVLIGGGYIGFEFAHIAARGGAEVAIVHRAARPLRRFEPELVDRLVEATRELGVAVHLETTALGVERQGDGLAVRVAADAGERTIPTDLVVHSAGRVPEIDDLDLAAGAVARATGGVAVNEYLQSVSNAAVYAAGDAVASADFRLTPVAAMQGAVVASNLLRGNHRVPDYRAIPSVAFTVPPIARVGLGEAAARAAGLRFRVEQAETSGWYSSRRVGLRHAGFKVLVEEESERILGAHLLGPQAEETINLFALAMRADLRADDLRHMVYTYPTSASDVPYMV